MMSTGPPNLRKLAFARDVGEQRAHAQMSLMQLRDAHLRKLRGYENSRYNHYINVVGGVEQPSPPPLPPLPPPTAQPRHQPALLPNFAARAAANRGHGSVRATRPPTLEMLRPRPQSASLPVGQLIPVAKKSQAASDSDSVPRSSSPQKARRAPSNKPRGSAKKDEMGMSWDALKKNLGSGLGAVKDGKQRAKLDTRHMQATAMGINSSALMLEAHDVFGAIDKDYSGHLDMHELDKVSTPRPLLLYEPPGTGGSPTPALVLTQRCWLHFLRRCASCSIGWDPGTPRPTLRTSCSLTRSTRTATARWTASSGSTSSRGRARSTASVPCSSCSRPSGRRWIRAGAFPVADRAQPARPARAQRAGSSPVGSEMSRLSHRLSTTRRVVSSGAWSWCLSVGRRHRPLSSSSRVVRARIGAPGGDCMTLCAYCPPCQMPEAWPEARAGRSRSLL